MIERKFGRRTILKGAFASLAAIPVVGVFSEAHATGVDVDPSGPKARERGYVADFRSSTDPHHKPGQRCANCGQYAGIPREEAGACGSFGWDNVSASGYCTHYVADITYLWGPRA